MTFLSTIRFRKAPPILKNPRGCPLTRNRTSVWEPGLAARQVAEFAIPMTFLKFSRGAEEEADYLGTQYMYRTGSPWRKTASPHVTTIDRAFGGEHGDRTFRARSRPKTTAPCCDAETDRTISST